MVEERGNEAAEIVSVEHFPAETSPDVTNDGMAVTVDNDEEVEQRQRRAVVAAEAEAALMAAEATSRMIRMAYGRTKAASREDRAASRIQSFYRGYLVIFFISDKLMVHFLFFFFFYFFVAPFIMFFLKKGSPKVL